MNVVKLCYTIMLATIFSSCSFNCWVGGDKSGVKTKPVTSADNTTLNGATIKNDIDLEATGVKLKEAYLLDANKERLVENITRVGERIYIVLKLDTGWVKENGKSFIGASERISTESGNVIVDATDVFKDYETTGISAADAKVISLSAVITQADTRVEDFVVRFRVWDKKGNGEIKGKYKFSIKK
ncbi:MAG: hypothetical protein ABI666_11270 [Ferruginibacter sp.]